ncbi:type II toxin-antitoxin system RelE/ParE family toxin [Luteibacter sp.]|uniref:type II toxin-antitoxin system RelE/ParE family toxin n=1 Tax=Luteibacter sp. TaxID=1886636 RepID=UPI003F806516
MASWLLTQSAERDLDALLSYLAQHRATSASRNIALVIFNQIELIAAHPLAFPEDSAGRRHSIVPRLAHRITYRYIAEADCVRVTAITHARRQWVRS